MSEKQWTYRKTNEREEKIEKLRQYLGSSRNNGQRIHGILTTAQILDWCIDATLAYYENRVITRSTTRPE